MSAELQSKPPRLLTTIFAGLRTTLLDWAEIAHSLNFALPQQADWQPHPLYRRNDSATPLSLQPLAHSQNWHIQFVSANNPTSLVYESTGVPSMSSQPIPNCRQAISWHDHQLPNSNSALCKIILTTKIHTGCVCKHQSRPRGAEQTRRFPPSLVSSHLRQCSLPMWTLAKSNSKVNSNSPSIQQANIRDICGHLRHRNLLLP